MATIEKNNYKRSKMSNFQIAYKTVKANEGGYRNVSYDKGGETYKGIARNFWGTWAGWKIIDEYKKQNGPIKLGAYINNPILDNLVLDFFKTNFWDRHLIGYVKNQSVATLMLDMVIQHGYGPREINKAVNTIGKVILGNKITTDTLNVINQKPQECYIAIVNQRIAYINTLDLGPDQKPVLQRAKAFLSKYSAEIATGGTALLLIGFFF